MVWTHYDNLQVGRKASKDVIKAAYRSLSQTHHPDRNPGQRERANRRMQLINRAYEVLMNDELRLAHDRWIAEQEEAEARARQRKRLDQDPPPVLIADYAAQWEARRRRRGWIRECVEAVITWAIIACAIFEFSAR